MFIRLATNYVYKYYILVCLCLFVYQFICYLLSENSAFLAFAYKSCTSICIIASDVLLLLLLFYMFSQLANICCCTFTATFGCSREHINSRVNLNKLLAYARASRFALFPLPFPVTALWRGFSLYNIYIYVYK